ncbi:dihydropteroate synthase [Actinopolyspora mzabensis]|uniref:Dihydropteroate synthase n=1 Tax=Actinopolyspora mzabensis TaxID=995066 RepID=A0A1G9EJE3_ACTMZ|nr:dihydropteroate synthase [Actinopolyspora mzabensis]SDK76203.1 dihydropteroate synthase [Actinopolyspora mzabensis]
MRTTVRFRGRELGTQRPLVMAIVNRTPDSFYDRGRTFEFDAALSAVDEAVADGADIVDVGGVKAGPGSVVGVDEEIERTAPFVTEVRRNFPDLVISVDTWRHEVGRAVCVQGADLLNDTWAGADPKLVEVAAEFQAGYVCSHTGGAAPRTRPHRVRYEDVVRSVVDETTRQAEHAAEIGVPTDGILIDPTHDFGKNTRHSLALLRHTDQLVATGWPVLMALSNKDFVGETLGTELSERVTGTLAATALAARDGATAFRVHEVRQTRQVLDMVAGITGEREPASTVRGLA